MTKEEFEEANERLLNLIKRVSATVPQETPNSIKNLKTVRYRVPNGRTEYGKTGNSWLFWKVSLTVTLRL